MSQFNTFARSTMLALVLTGSGVGTLDTMANPQSPITPPTRSMAGAIDLPPPPQIESVESALTTSGDKQVQSKNKISPPPPSPRSDVVTISPNTEIATPPPSPSPSSTVVTIPPPPPTPEYCYVGTWEVRDLSQYWLPLVQKFAQTKVSSKKTQGRVQITFTRDGYTIFEARNFQQQYQPKSAPSKNKFNEFELTLQGRATADYTEKKGMKLSFSAPNYRWFNSQLNLGEDLNVTGDRLFNLYGKAGQTTVTLPYDCLDHDTIVLKLQVPKTEKFISLKLKRLH